MVGKWLNCSRYLWDARKINVKYFIGFLGKHRKRQSAYFKSFRLANIFFSIAFFNKTAQVDLYFFLRQCQETEASSERRPITMKNEGATLSMVISFWGLTFCTSWRRARTNRRGVKWRESWLIGALASLLSRREVQIAGTSVLWLTCKEIAQIRFRLLTSLLQVMLVYVIW